MEYVFGEVTHKGVTYECVKTKGSTHTDLSGMVQVKREFSDAIIYDNFTVLEKYRSMIDEEGNCYDWYMIEGHYRYEDKYTPNIGKVEERLDADITDTKEGLMETYDLTSSNADEIADCRTALEELYEMMIGE